MLYNLIQMYWPLTISVVGAAMDWLFNNPDDSGVTDTNGSAPAPSAAGFSIGTREDLQADKEKVVVFSVRSERKA